jgi:prephenate dehydratase
VNPSATTVAYFGPAATFTQEALLTQPDLAEAELTSLSSITGVLDAVAQGDVDFGFVPIENGIEGTVSATIDGLIHDVHLHIQREVVLDIHLHLMARPGTTLGDVRSVSSYPHALAQCQKYLAQELPKAERYGLVILAEDVEDHPDNQTRFVLVAETRVPKPTGHDKTSIVCFQRADHPGSLHGILGQFAARNINLTKLESRPTKQGLGDYCFVIDLSGHIGDEVVADCLRDLHAGLAGVKFLGSYPAGGEHGPEQRRQADAAWQAADDWLRELRGSIR